MQHSLVPPAAAAHSQLQQHMDCSRGVRCLCATHAICSPIRTSMHAGGLTQGVVTLGLRAWELHGVMYKSGLLAGGWPKCPDTWLKFIVSSLHVGFLFEGSVLCVPVNTVSCKPCVPTGMMWFSSRAA